MLNSTQQKICLYDSKGLKPSQIASIVNVSESYISQLRKEQEYAEALAELARQAQPASQEAEAAREAEEDSQLTLKYTATENKVLSIIEQQLPFAEFPMLVNALKVLGDRQEKRAARKSHGAALAQLGRAAPGTVNVIALQLPGHVMQQSAAEYEVNTQGQITAINGQVLSPMGSQGVKQLFATAQASLAPQVEAQESTLCAVEMQVPELATPAQPQVELPDDF